MLLNHSKIYLVFVMVFLLSSCALFAKVDTLNKRIALFEVSYEQVLITVDRWIADGRLAGDHKQRVKQYINDIYKTRLAMYVALKAGAKGNAEEKLKTSILALELVQRYDPEKPLMPLPRPEGN